MDERLRAKVRGLKVKELRAAFPGEAQCHRDMLSRARAGEAIVSDDIKSFRAFLLTVGERPNKLWTIDRINPADPEYAPSKIRWADKRQQANNRTTTIFLNVDGTLKPLTSWARQTGQNANTIRQRIKRGYTHEEAVYPKRRKHRTKHVGKNATEDTQHDRWPAPLSAAEFEKPYGVWTEILKKRPDFPATRRVFAYWISRNRANSLLKGLATKYPDTFGAEATPDEDADLAIDDDPLYQNYLRYRELSERLFSEMYHHERSFHSSVLAQRVVLWPQDAVILFRTIMNRDT